MRQEKYKRASGGHSTSKIPTFLNKNHKNRECICQDEGGWVFFFHLLSSLVKFDRTNGAELNSVGKDATRCEENRKEPVLKRIDMIIRNKYRVHTKCLTSKCRLETKDMQFY